MRDGNAAELHRRTHRVAVHLSEVDRRLKEKGLPTSFEERVSSEDVEVSARGAEGRDFEVGSASASQPSQSCNDARLLENVPPHSQPRI